MSRKEVQSHTSGGKWKSGGNRGSRACACSRGSMVWEGSAASAASKRRGGPGRSEVLSLVAVRVTRSGRGTTHTGAAHRVDGGRGCVPWRCVRDGRVATRLAQVGTRLAQDSFSEHRGCSNCSNLFQPLSSSGEKSQKNLNKKRCDFFPPKPHRSFGRLEHGTVGTSCPRWSMAYTSSILRVGA